MDVKLVSRTINLFELLAAEKKPLSLAEISRLMDVPMSSCFALVRTLVNRGYLYEVRKRGGYYPTRRLLFLAQAIDAADPIIEMLHPRLVELRDKSGETAVLGKVQGPSVLYLDIVESVKPIRYSPAAGELRPLHANSIGKAIFNELTPQEQQSLGSQLEFTYYNDKTVSNLSALLAQMEAVKARGWAVNLGETAPELSAVAVALKIGGDLYGISIVGPTERIEKSLNVHGAMLLDTKAEIEAQS